MGYGAKNRAVVDPVSRCCGAVSRRRQLMAMFQLVPSSTEKKPSLLVTTVRIKFFSLIVIAC